jgi:hypothetical protein
MTFSASRFTQEKADEDVFLLESDVNELAQAKGANVAGLHAVFSSYGIDFDDIDVFYLAGGFGRHLNVEASKRIGLVPSLDSKKIVQAGNTAIEGATIALLSKSKRQELEELVKKVEHCRLETHPTSSIFRGRLPVQARGADSMREVAEAIELAGTLFPICNVLPEEYVRCSAIRAAGCSRAVRWSWRIGRGIGTRRMDGRGSMRGKRRASKSAATRFTLMECSSPASGCRHAAAGGGPQRDSGCGWRGPGSRGGISPALGGRKAGRVFLSLRFSAPRSSSIWPHGPARVFATGRNSTAWRCCRITARAIPNGMSRSSRACSS